MEVPSPGAALPRLRRAIWYLVGGTFAALGLTLLLVFLHAYFSAQYLVLPVYALGGLMVALAAGSALAGVCYAWRAYPRHRGAVVFVVAITAATLLAHAYILGEPPAADGAVSISGPIGTPLHSVDSDQCGNPQLTVTSSFSNGQLQVTLAATGSASDACKGRAFVDPTLVSPAAAGGQGFAPLPDFQNPLEPGQSVTGNWTVAGPVTGINVTYQELDCYKTSAPAGYGCIMDEVYYIPEGMSILNGAQCSTTGAPSYCHMEHPFLTPALIAAGMAVFGEFNVVGWRALPALLGSFSLPLVFGIVWKLAEDKKAAYVATTLLALDVMYFAQSNAGLLDVPQVFFALAAFFAYFAELRWWKFDRYVVAGVLLGVAGLAKETAVFLALALLTYIFFFGEGDRWVRVYDVLKVTLVVGIVFAVGLQAYDSTLAAQAGTLFTQQVGYIISYGSSLNAGCPWACGWTSGVLGGHITPLDWLVYYTPIAYFGVTDFVGGISFPGLWYYGVTNLMVTWTTFVWLPLIVWNLVAYWRSRRAPGTELVPSTDAPGSPAPPPPDAPSSPSLKFAAFALIYFAWTYVPYIFIFLGGRVTYPFYIIPAVPAMSMGASYWMSKRWFPKWLLAVYLVMVFGFFLVYFPDKSFLPIWVRVLLRH